MPGVTDRGTLVRRPSIQFARLVSATLLLACNAFPQQPITSSERSLAQEMLRVVANDVRKHYYDPKLHGLDWDAKIAAAKQKIDNADSLSVALSKIAGLLDALNDSHTFFLPPQRRNRYEYGLQYQMVGDRCFITRVRPKSDAEAKGVKPGDEILALNGFVPNRDNLWKMQYVYSVLRPQPEFQLDLQDFAGGEHQVNVTARIHQDKAITDLTGGVGSDAYDVLRRLENDDYLASARYAELSDQLIALKLPEFMFSQAEAESIIKRARKYSAMIIDLRGNPGGAIESLEYLIGGVFDRDVKIADRIGRKESKPEVAKTGHTRFSGRLVVLVDAKSASAAELFANVVQVEKRGMVIGDHTSGSVMEARHYGERIGFDTVVFYGASITEWDLVMANGRSLEHVGVTPDETLLPNAKDLANGNDPAMSRAAELLGVKLGSDQAGKLFPYEWPSE